MRLDAGGPEIAGSGFTFVLRSAERIAVCSAEPQRVSIAEPAGAGRLAGRPTDVCAES